MLSIGLMSGTSMDGIDAALLETDGTPNQLKELAHTSINYADEFKLLLKAMEFAVRQHSGDLVTAKRTFSTALICYLKNVLMISSIAIDQTITRLANYLGLMNKPILLDDIIQHSTQLHANITMELLQQTHLSANQIDVVGYHGQTLYHQPSKGISITVGDGQALAKLLNITVVNDFRRRDIEAGGQGAPFAPLYHQALAIRDNKLPLAVVNCGGIANISLIYNENEVIGFDTGPGNALIDSLIRQRTQGQQNMDEHGQYGMQGKVDQSVLQLLYEKSANKQGKNYFAMAPPKALDYGDIELIYELNELSIYDACATLEAFTADSIVESVNALKTKIPHHWILAGGGWKNPVIVNELKQRLKQKLGNHLIIETADEAGWNSQALEAQLFAYLAVRRLKNLPLSFPSTTGVSQPISGGVVHTFYSN